MTVDHSVLETVAAVQVGVADAYKPTAVFMVVSNEGFRLAICTNVLSLASLPSAMGCTKGSNVFHKFVTLSICCKMQALVVGEFKLTLLSPLSRPTCESANNLIVPFKAALFPAASTPKATNKASLDIFWLNMRWRPAMSTVAPGTAAPAAVAAETYKLTTVLH